MTSGYKLAKVPKYFPTRYALYHIGVKKGSTAVPEPKIRVKVQLGNWYIHGV